MSIYCHTLQSLYVHTFSYKCREYNCSKCSLIGLTRYVPPTRTDI